MKEEIVSNTANLRNSERNYGIDLLRTVSMIMVALLHVLGQGGILEKVIPLSLNYQIAWFLEIGAYCAVNCYALISGYVGIRSKFKYANIIHLYLTVVFYTLSITALFAIFVPGSVGIKDFIKAVFPFAYNVYWYFTAYFCIFFFIPFFNHLINTLGRKQARRLIITIVIVFSVLPTVFYSDMFYTNGGYSALWLGALYLLGAYISKYQVGSNLKKTQLLIIYLISIVLTWLSKLCIEFVTSRILGMPKGGYFLVNYCSPTILIAGVSLLLLFSKFRFNNRINKLIKFFSPLAFSVYLIHVEPLIWNYVIKDRFVKFADLHFLLLILAVLLAALSIWLVCSILDVGRYYIFKILKAKERCGKLGAGISKILCKIKWKKHEG